MLPGLIGDRFPAGWSGLQIRQGGGEGLGGLTADRVGRKEGGDQGLAPQGGGPQGGLELGLIPGVAEGDGQGVGIFQGRREERRPLTVGDEGQLQPGHVRSGGGADNRRTGFMGREGRRQ